MKVVGPAIRVCVLAGALAGAGPVAAASPDTIAAQRAALWLDGQALSAPGQMADAIVALRATGRSQASLTGRLATLGQQAGPYGVTAGAAGKVTLAAVAAGRDPRALAGIDYIARIKRTYRTGRYGSTAYDQAYAMLGLRAAGEPVPGGAIRLLRRTRGAGGWSFSIAGGRDDVSATGLLLEALRAAGVAPSDPVIGDAATWLAGRANAQGGFNINGGRRPTEANSTAIAIRAARAAGRKPLSRWRVALRSLQEPDGAVRFAPATAGNRVMATVDALVAFSGTRLPVR